MMQASGGTPRAPSAPRPGGPSQAPGSGPVIAPMPAPVPPQEGVIVVNPTPSPEGRNNDFPDNAMYAGITFFIVAGLVIVLFPFVRALARRMDRSAAAPASQNPALAREVADRLQRIEHAVDSISLEVERISEGQRFTTRLLADRAPVVPVERQGGSGT